MNNTLIICWDSNYLNIIAPNLTTSILEEAPTTNISLLVQTCDRVKAETVPGVKNVFTLDEDKIKSVINNKLYFNSHGINHIERCLSNIKLTNWTSVINLSNKPLPVILASYLNAKVHVGKTLSLKSEKCYSNGWSLFSDEVAPHLQTSPFHDLDMALLTSDVTYSYGGIKTATVPSHNENAHKNINQLRQSEESDVRVVGINLINSNQLEKNQIKLLKNLTRFLFESEEICPLLIVSEGTKEKEIAKEFRDEIGESLYTVEADDIALPSVLINIDSLVSFNIPSRYTADLTETATFVLFDDYNTMLRHGPTVEDSVSFVCSNITNLDCDEGFEFISACLQNIGKPNKEVPPYFNAYITKIGQFGTEFYSLSENGIHLHYLNNFFSRAYAIKKELVHLDSKAIDENLKVIPYTHLKTYCGNEKERMTEVLRSILQALRVLKQVNNNSDQRKLFLVQLEKIFEIDLGGSPLCIPMQFFRMKLDRLQSGNTSDNLKMIETFLFDLKGEVQNLNQLLVDIEQMSYRREAEIDTAKRRGITL